MSSEDALRKLNVEKALALAAMDADRVRKERGWTEEIVKPANEIPGPQNINGLWLPHGVSVNNLTSKQRNYLANLLRAYGQTPPRHGSWIDGLSKRDASRVIETVKDGQDNNTPWIDVRVRLHQMGFPNA